MPKTKEQANRYQRNWYKRFRVKVLLHYGKSCECCGETQEEFLTLDHINGGGTQHRKSLGYGGSRFYRWLHAAGYPEGYRVLCYNCNCSLGARGYCPHQTLCPSC